MKILPIIDAPFAVSSSCKTARCHLEFGWLLHLFIQDIHGVGITVRYSKGCLHGNHWLRQVAHLLIILCPKGRNIFPTDTTQSHHLKISLWDDPMYHIHTWEHGTCMQFGTIRSFECSHRLGGHRDIPQMCLRMHHWTLDISAWCLCLPSTCCLHKLENS